MNAEAKNKEITLKEKEEIQRDGGELLNEGVFYSPHVDISETEDAIFLHADLPGVEKDKLNIHVEDKELTITGLVSKPEDRLHSLYQEYGIGGYTRNFRLGDTIDQQKISATLNDGVLKLVLPKAEKLKPRKIDIN